MIVNIKDELFRLFELHGRSIDDIFQYRISLFDNKNQSYKTIAYGDPKRLKRMKETYETNTGYQRIFGFIVFKDGCSFERQFVLKHWVGGQEYWLYSENVPKTRNKK